MLLFWQKGYSGTTLDDLEAATDLKRVSLYNAFGDKKTLFLATLRRYRTLVARRVLEPLHRPDAGLDAIRAIFERLSEPSANRGPGGCLIVNTSVDQSPLDDDVRAQVELHFGSIQAGLQRVLETARSQGRLAADVDCRAAAAYLNTLLQGIGVMSRDPGRSGEVQAAVEVVLSQLDAWQSQTADS